MVNTNICINAENTKSQNLADVFCSFTIYFYQMPDVIILLEWLSSDYLSSLLFAKK